MPTRLSQHRSHCNHATGATHSRATYGSGGTGTGGADGITIHQLLAGIEVPGGLRWN